MVPVATQCLRPHRSRSSTQTNVILLKMCAWWGTAGPASSGSACHGCALSLSDSCEVTRSSLWNICPNGSVAFHVLSSACEVTGAAGAWLRASWGCFSRWSPPVSPFRPLTEHPSQGIQMADHCQALQTRHPTASMSAGGFQSEV